MGMLVSHSYNNEGAMFINLMEGTKDRMIFLERTSVNFDIPAL